MVWYKLVVAYDGTDYHGWQWQPHVTTVEKILKIKLSSLFNLGKDNFYLVAASRTDAGVHAEGQVVRFGMPFDLPEKKLQTIINNKLPSDIVITLIKKVTPEFHPQKNVHLKTYCYTIFLERPSPKIQRFGWFFKNNLDQLAFNKALQLFVGKHNFFAFCKYAGKSTVKIIDSIVCKKKGTTITVVIKGKSFLHFMIRRIVGAAITVASKKEYSFDLIEDALQNKKLQKTFVTAPAKGLCLYSIDYQ